MKRRSMGTLVLALALAGCGGDDGAKVPDVTGLRALDAQRTIGEAGFSAKLDPKPASPTKCKVTDQSARGRLPGGAEIVLRVSCPFREGED